VTPRGGLGRWRGHLGLVTHRPRTTGPGPHAPQAIFYPEDDRYLIDRDLTVRHYEVASPQ